MENPASGVLQSRHRESSDLLLDIAVLLMSSGAHTERVNRNVGRIADSLGYSVQLFFSFSGITLTLSNKDLSVTTKYGVSKSVCVRGEYERGISH